MMDPIVVHTFDFRTETGHGFRMLHAVSHQGHLYELFGIDTWNRDHKIKPILNAHNDWFTWSSAMLLEYHAKYSDDWQGRMRTLREDKAFLDNLFPVPVADRQSRSGPPDRGST